MARPTARDPSFLDANRLYTRRGFICDSGISDTKLREAALKHGLRPPWIVCGKRKFMRGCDAIAFVEKLAELQTQEQLAGAAT